MDQLVVNRMRQELAAKSPRFQRCQNRYMRYPGVGFACGRCRPCIARRCHDYAGRAIAESFGSDACFMTTLTIGGDNYYYGVKNNPKAQSFCREDLQKYLWRKRKYLVYDKKKEWIEAGNRPALFVPPRYRCFYVGEYGDRLGRPHYHLLEYLQGCTDFGDGVPQGVDFFHGRMDVSMKSYVDAGVMPHVPSDRTYWPWGFTNTHSFQRRDAWYVSKYVTKTFEEMAERSLHAGPVPQRTMTPGRPCRPMMGAGYFDYLAGQHVDDMLPVQNEGYKLPREAGYAGFDAVHFMSKAGQRYFACSYMRQWRDRHEREPSVYPSDWPWSPLIDRFVRSYDRQLAERTAEHALYETEFRLIMERNRLADQAAARRAAAWEARRLALGEDNAYWKARVGY